MTNQNKINQKKIKSKIKKLQLMLPFILFLLISGLLFRGLTLRPEKIPSPLIGKSVPKFNLPTLENKKNSINESIFLGHVSLLNVWATWCALCAYEHPLLLELAKQQHIIIYGFNYRDDTTAAKEWLQQAGNPYQLILSDPSGMIAIDWGIYGTPETFVIDKKGYIRYRQIGIIDRETWDKKLKPLVQQLEQE